MVPNIGKERNMIINHYKGDYQMNSRLNARGRVVDDICYTGDYYILKISESEKKKTKLWNFAFSIGIFSFLIIAGLLNQDSSRTAWIVFPYLMIYIPSAYLMRGSIAYVTMPKRMQKIQFDNSIARMKHSGIGILILTLISMCLDILYMFLHYKNINWGRESLYFLAHVLILALTFLFGKYYDKKYADVTMEPSKVTLE